MDLIASRTEKALKLLSQLEGLLSAEVNQIRRSLVDMLAEIEVNLDYPEYDFEEVTLDKCGIVVVR